MFGLGDGHSFTTQQQTRTRTHTDTHTRERAHGQPRRARLVAQAWPRPIWGGAQGGGCCGPRAPSGGGCDGTGSRRWCQGGERRSGKDGVKEPSQAPCSPPPGPCKPLKALLGHLLENGGVLVSFPMKGPSPPHCPLFSRDPLAAVGRYGVGVRQLGSGVSAPRAFPAHDPWHGRQSVGP